MTSTHQDDVNWGSSGGKLLYTHSSVLHHGMGEMKPEPSFRRGVTLILLGAGFFQLFAAGTAAFFWTFTGEWERYMPAIISMGMLAWPAAYWLWRKYEEESR
jgi:hypothetical protein